MEPSSWILLAGGLLAGYTLIPDLFLHHLGIGSYKGHLGPGTVLTFDDGPDPVYTPALLDLLDCRGIKAVFFLVGEKARAHPELVTEILGRGHQIGLHGQVHQHAWLMGPVRTWQLWDQGKAELERLSGRPVEWVRPPWGVFNLVTWLWFRRRRLKAVLWTAEGRDWRERDPHKINGRILRRIDEGSILDLHDQGRKKINAPRHMLWALEEILDRLEGEEQIPVVPLRLPDYPPLRRQIVRLWNIWEAYYARSNAIRRVGPDNIYRITTITYDGPDLIDKAGQVLARSGDLVGELHLNNYRIQTEETDPARVAIGVIRKIKNSLPGLAAYIEQHPEYAAIKVFVSITLLNRGISGFGFQVEELPRSFKNWRIGLLQKIILRVYHPGGNYKKMGQPKLVWITREVLMERWLPVPELSLNPKAKITGQDPGEPTPALLKTAERRSPD